MRNHGSMGKPKVIFKDFHGPGGNVFSLIGQVKKALIKCHMTFQAKEMQQRALKAGSYNEVLDIFKDYIEWKIGDEDVYDR